MVVFVSAPCVLATILIAIDNRAGKHYISAMANDGDREQLIRSAVKGATNKGIQLTAQTWGVVWSKKDKRWVPKSDQKCCALSCVILEYQDNLARRLIDWREYTLQTLLDCNANWIASFISGFDGHAIGEGSYGFSYELGLILRDELTSGLPQQTFSFKSK